MKYLKGIVPVLITPFKNTGEIDREGLENVVRHLLKRNVAGLWVLGTGGEDFNLTLNERVFVARVVSNLVDGAIPVILGCSFFSDTEIKDFINQTSGMNFDAYHLMPYQQRIDQRCNEEMFLEIADYVEKPMWVYSSGNYGQMLRPEVIHRLSKHDNIVGVKYSTSNLVDLENVLQLNNSKFQVISAVVRQFLPSLALGVDATTTVEACYLFELVEEIYKSFINDDLARSRAAQARLNRVLEDISTNAAERNFFRVAEGKFILSKLGLCGTRMSGYFHSVSKDDGIKINEILKTYEINI